MDILQYIQQCEREDRAGLNEYLANQTNESPQSEDIRPQSMSDMAYPSVPQIFNISNGLIRGCAATTCLNKNGLSRCSACKAVQYCSREHQHAHRSAHRAVCNKIKKARANFEKEEKALKREEGDQIFKMQRGFFWGIIETRPYMRARFDLVDSLSKVNTLLAVQSGLDNVLEMLQLCRGDNLGVREMVPSLYLRLGRVQDCYDFCKWWHVIERREPRYDWGDNKLPYLDTKDADVFEEAEAFTGDFLALPHTVAITLVKIKLMLDLQTLQRVQEEAGPHVPREILNEIGSYAMNTNIANKPSLLERADHARQILQLKQQIKTMYETVKESNKHFWPALLKPGNNLRIGPQPYTFGSEPQMRLALQFSYNAWVETPGAIDVIRILHKQDTGSSSSR